MLADGRTFYYSDYNAKGRKVYSDHRWPCCAGTLPQVAADYRINTYFGDAGGVYVNLYIPSVLRWTQSGTYTELTQKTDYPRENLVQFEVRPSKAVEFALNLRIPAWAVGASILVNGHRAHAAASPGSFVTIRRVWKAGDRVELDLPLTMRLEAVDAQHLETVALLAGPLVLFAIGDAPATLTRAALLAARRTGAQSWEAGTGAGTVKLLPWTTITDEQYSTYLQVAKS
jgi:DUF1680 family protein